MNIQTQRWLDRVVGSLICRVLSLVSFFRREADPPKPRNILVILLSEMGALVLARPMLDRLRERYPEARLNALVFRQNREVLDLVGAVPEANVVTIRSDTALHLARDGIGALWRIRRASIDTVIDCELFARISSIFSFLSGASTRVGFHPHTQEGLYRGSFINRRVLYNPYQHIAVQFLGLAEAIESSDTPAGKRAPATDTPRIPMMEPAAHEIEGLRQRLEADFPQLVGKTLVLVYPGAGLLPIRAWPIESYCVLAEALTGRGLVLGVIGLEGDRALARTIQSRCEDDTCVDLTGYTKSVRELMLLFHLGALLVTNDGGPVHFASMTPIPSIIFYGPETPALYGPVDGKSIALFRGLACSPCLTAYNHRSSPCDGDNVCLKSITPGSVLEKATEVLRRTGAFPVR
jgi:ADP-heptose:LPS heptosyltransferase